MSSLGNNPHSPKQNSEFTLPLRELPTPHQRKMIEIQVAQVEAANGITSGNLFVDKVGCMPVTNSTLTDAARKLFETLLVDKEAPDGAQLAQALSHQTYFTYPEKVRPASATIEHVVRQSGHRSVVKPVSVTSLIAGISIDDAIQLVSLGGGIGRLTTSNTNAMNATLYQRAGAESDRTWQTEFIARFLDLRESVRLHYQPRKLSTQGFEYFNMFNLSSKTIALFHTMNLKELHTFAYGLAKLSHLSTALVQLKNDITSTLSELYPGLIEQPDYYKPRITPITSSHPATRAELLRQVDESGGTSEDQLFVSKPGCKLIGPPQEALDSFFSSSRESYLKFLPISFELTGIAYETVLELVAHQEAHIPLVPHNRLQYMAEPAYRVQGKADEIAWQKEAIKRFLDLRTAILTQFNTESIPQELINSYNLGSRAVQVEFTMSLADFHKLFIGRLAPSGNESDVQEICRQMCEQLYRLAPDIILDPSRYSSLGNEAKYK